MLRHSLLLLLLFLMSACAQPLEAPSTEPLAQPSPESNSWNGVFSGLSFDEMAQLFASAIPAERLPKESPALVLPDGIARVLLFHQPIAHPMRSFQTAIWGDRRFFKQPKGGFESRRTFLGAALRGETTVAKMRDLLRLTKPTVVRAGLSSTLPEIPIDESSTWVLDFSKSKVTVAQGVLEELRALPHRFAHENAFIGRVFVNGQFYSFVLISFRS